MSAGGNIADVIRTALVGGTVAFLGYLGYNLIQLRINNPPPRVVTMEDTDVGEIRAGLAELSGEIQGLQRDCALRGSLSTPIGVRRAAIEFGTAAIQFTNDAPHANVDILFRNRYRSPPVVLALDNQATGHFPIVKVRRVTTTGCNINADNRAVPSEPYEDEIGYVVIGELAE